MLADGHWVPRQRSRNRRYYPPCYRRPISTRCRSTSTDPFKNTSGGLLLTLMRMFVPGLNHHVRYQWYQAIPIRRSLLPSQASSAILLSVPLYLNFHRRTVFWIHLLLRPYYLQNTSHGPVDPPTIQCSLTIDLTTEGSTHCPVQFLLRRTNSWDI